MAPQQITVQLPDNSAPSQPKAGIKTSEGITATILQGYMAAQAALGFMPVPQAAKYMLILACVYAVARNGLKAAHALGFARNIPDLPDDPKAQ